MRVRGLFSGVSECSDHAVFVSAADSPHNRLPLPAASWPCCLRCKSRNKSMT